MFIVRFVRKDRKPDEEYYYPSLDDAEQHYYLFINDDSGLYHKITIEVLKGREYHPIAKMIF